MNRIAIGVVLGLSGWLAGCGGGGDMTSPNTGCPSTAGVSIASTGFTPRAVCVVAGGSVTFTNADTIPHDVESATSTCTQLNLGAIANGASRAASFPLTETCGFRDAAHPGDPAFVGTVAVGSVPPGPGY